MSGDRLDVSVTFDPAKGYVATVPDLTKPITALSLALLRRRIEERLLPDSVEVRLMLDRAARLERDRRRGAVRTGWATMVANNATSVAAKTRWNNLSGGLAVSVTAGPSGRSISPHPSSREGHHSTVRWISGFSPI
jgi:hypothetical protein